MVAGCGCREASSAHQKKDGVVYDGNELFLKVCKDLNVPVLELVVRTARWVHPAVFRELPLWYPAHARKMPLFKADWSTPQMVKGKRAIETNFKGQETLDKALGIASENRKNWTCCHIWGYSDETFQSASLTNNPRYYTCPANMMQLPTPLKALTDSMPSVQLAIRVCVWNTYGWTPDTEDAEQAALVRSGHVPAGYPTAWPRSRGAPLPQGVQPVTKQIRHAMAKRKRDIKRNLARHEAGSLPHYPADQVRQLLRYWRIQL